jgi:hypothetical protein
MMALIDHLKPKTTKLYSIQQTPRGSVVVLGSRIISEHEMPTEHAQQQADCLNDRRKHG